MHHSQAAAQPRRGQAFATTPLLSFPRDNLISPLSLPSTAWCVKHFVLWWLQLISTQSRRNPPPKAEARIIDRFLGLFTTPDPDLTPTAVMAKRNTKPEIKESKAPQRFACVICGRRKPAEDFPLDKDHNVRVAITCNVCLAPTYMADQSDMGLLEKLHPNLENGTESITANMLKRKYDDSFVLTNQQKKKTKFNLPKSRAPLPTSATCSICCEEKPALEFPSRPPSGKKALSKYSDVPGSCAKHLHLACDTPVCKECITAYLTASLDLKEPDKLGCPASGCKAIWGQKFIRAYLTVHAFANYSQLLFQRFITKENIVWCHDPLCGEGGIIESRNGIKTIPPGYPNLECATCKKRQCVLCKVEWHKDMTCQEYRAEHGEDRDFEEHRVLQMMMHKGARRCRHCQLAVEKDGGCDYMLCM